MELRPPWTKSDESDRALESQRPDVHAFWPRAIHYSSLSEWTIFPPTNFERLGRTSFSSFRQTALTWCRSTPKGVCELVIVKWALGRHQVADDAISKNHGAMFAACA